jgi:hypothetical protein
MIPLLSYNCDTDQGEMIIAFRAGIRRVGSLGVGSEDLASVGAP